MNLGFQTNDYSANPGGITGAINTVSSTVGAIVPGVSLAVDLITTIGKLIGIAPRGDLQKFHRTVYPYLRTLAQKANVKVYCFWFGDAVQVSPDGSYGIAIPNLNSVEEAKAKIGILQGDTPWYYAGCGRSDDDCVNHPDGLAFEPHGNMALASGSGSVISSVLSGGSIWPIVLIGGGLIGFAFWSAKK